MHASKASGTRTRVRRPRSRSTAPKPSRSTPRNTNTSAEPERFLADVAALASRVLRPRLLCQQLLDDAYTLELQRRAQLPQSLTVDERHDLEDQIHAALPEHARALLATYREAWDAAAAAARETMFLAGFACGQRVGGER